MAERFNAAVLKTVYLKGTFVRIKLIPNISMYFNNIIWQITHYFEMRLGYFFNPLRKIFTIINSNEYQHPQLALVESNAMQRISMI